MSLTRRSLILAGAGLAALPASFLSASGLHAAEPAAPSSGPDSGPDSGLASAMSERAMGKPDAKVTVQEWFSLTCTHCSRFSQVVFPEVKAKLIDTGKIRYVFHDFPLDQVALTAAMVARSLPPERYEPFIDSLFASQDHWAFSQSNDPVAEIGKMAALAGMSHDTYEKVVADQTLKQAILDEQNGGQAKYKIDSTPSFIFGGTLFAGEMDYDTFAKKVADLGA